MTDLPQHSGDPYPNDPYPGDPASTDPSATNPLRPDPVQPDPATGPSGTGAPGTIPGDTPADTAPGHEPPARPDPLRSSRTGRAWVSIIALGVVLVLLIVFIAQNTRSVTVSFLGWQGRTPLAVALLIATVAGLFLAGVAGTLRIWQLRRRVKREARRDTKRRRAA
ncbi:lipopolysaccharide assembly protein LapA domain-containing protein [Nocardioides sp. BP30]|uniref:LapA family protein n=1 Tax=Nocardioides sp. BP30 TaxID=3036374 RepID=UPI0024699766|nr:lipopolysaccharide assembly protein LapA domain-containing protein [Nocardioides sp. BP30]WGL51028.1 lipopolysaccharide assembly protein LapA domain-containing protein [Nocardioides sp. BP30]